ncbi:hypothetical protein [Streptacidiphilus sp. EB129]|uniref:hypothetical protein n=1 Tax=Streptacidiphilus sp. EB129 TaxID=3156262 RepID=UPI003515EDC2
MTTPTPARTLRYLCADWLVSNADREPDRVLRRIAQTAADHIAAAYSTTLAPLVPGPDHWTPFHEARRDGSRRDWYPELAVAYLGDSTWLLLSVWDYDPIVHRLLLVTPCDLHGGYRTHWVQHSRDPHHGPQLLGSKVVPGDEEDLALLLEQLDRTPCPGDCGSVPSPAADLALRSS